MNFEITILIPNYNNGKYIYQTLDSIFASKYENFLVIICDDASTDNSLEIINEFSTIYPDKIILIKHDENQGLLKTTTDLYMHIKTPYFTVLDSDDYWEDSLFLTRAMKFLTTNIEYSLYAENYKLYRNDKTYSQAYIPNINITIDQNNIHKIPFWPHTSSSVFKNIVFNKGIPNTLQESLKNEHLRLRCEQSYGGDMYRNIVHIVEGKGYITSFHTNGVYRIISSGRWTMLTDVQKTISNYIFWLNMFRYYNGIINIKTLKMLIDNAYGIGNHFLKTNIKHINSILTPEYIVFIKYLLYHNSYGIQINYIYPTYVFFLHSKRIGGFQIFFMGIAKYLSEHGCKVYYIDFPDGFAAKQLSNTKIIFKSYSTINFSIIFNEPLNFIIPFTMASEISGIKLMKPHTKLYYIGHTKSYDFLKFRSKLKDKQLNKLIEGIKHNTCSMDEVCSYEISKKFNICLPLIPVYTTPNNIENKSCIIHPQNINIGYLGRLDSDKIYALLNLMECLDKYKTPLIKNIHIIGEGECEKLLNKQFNTINIIKTGSLINQDKIHYIINNIDIMFSFGISMIECASLKIPSVSIPCFIPTDLYNEKDFCYFYDLCNYNCGYYINDIYKLHNYKPTTFMSIMDDIYTHNKKDSIGQKCYTHYMNFHTLDRTIAGLFYFLYNRQT